ncbi:NADH dehydrogenase subunit 5 [Bacillus ginsengihumi]|uniref:Probable inorganic carbon transporter subunit DabB n=1 Tax=Heyndrickxia ginsengihumi TaxID=363870 RepID=A0A6M0PAD2_9BACI|nr:NADH dehydrogenase subunit 5 [Heyndrickxia ginsengihumi]NEY21383.1 NADH dehydrogenase subunit 5 [Heyndrickxia ginsengihumi]
MLIQANYLLLTSIFFLTLAVAIFSALLLLHPRIPLYIVRIHIGIIAVPPLIALIILVTETTHRILGPWRLDPLAWLMALFVLTIGLIIQRYSVRYLLGDQFYRKYFAFLTITTGAASLTWLCNDLRLLVLCWGITLLGLTKLIGLNKKWQVARNTAAFSGRLFAFSWLILLVSIIWLAQVTGHWQLSLALSENSLKQFAGWERTGINLLLVLAIVIPAAQWPFQRWLLESAVVPTPVSAVMHAGIVNVGGIMLTRFAPLFDGSLAQIFLLCLASISVLLGTGMILVQVDYKRQLAASTIAQMGFMLIQCALGSYVAAIMHLILHGLFKATLFLQSGSAVRHYEKQSKISQRSFFLWKITGVVLGVFIVEASWLTGSREGYQLISSIILGWSLSFAWTRMIAYSQGVIERVVGFIMLGVVAVVFITIHHVLSGVLYTTVYQGVKLPLPIAVSVLFILLLGSVIGMWLARNRSSTSFALLYLWLVRLGDPLPNSSESHPRYLMHYLSRGGNQ